MTHPLTIEVEQPSGGLWLSPGKRVDHLIAILDVTSIESRYDELAKKEKDLASFRFVDLDQERELMSGMDNHPGITNKLKVNNPKAVLGRIGQIPATRQGFDPTLILNEHTPADLARFQQWAASQSTQPHQTATTPDPVSPQPVPEPAPAPQPADPPEPTPQPQPQPVEANGAAPAIDVTKLDPATRALIQQQLAKQDAGQS